MEEISEGGEVLGYFFWFWLSRRSEGALVGEFAVEDLVQEAIDRDGVELDVR